MRTHGGWESGKADTGHFRWAGGRSDPQGNLTAAVVSASAPSARIFKVYREASRGPVTSRFSGLHTASRSLQVVTLTMAPEMGRREGRGQEPPMPRQLAGQPGSRPLRELPCSERCGGCMGHSKKAQPQSSAGKCKLKQCCDTTTRPLKGLKEKKRETDTVSVKDVKQVEPSRIASGKVK